MKNFFKQNRLIYQEAQGTKPDQSTETSLREAGLNYIPGPRENDLNNIPEQYSRDQLEELRQSIKEEKGSEEPPAVQEKMTPRSREKIRKRMTAGIFNNNPELLKRYSDAVKKAIDKMEKTDELYKFILAHTLPQQTYAKGEHVDWNKEFCALLDKYLEEDLRAGNDTKEQQYIVGGLQDYLIDYFRTEFNNADVFEADKSARSTNPFIWGDGKMGAYTMSVMAEYWNKEYGPKSKDKKLDRADIDESLAQTSRQVYTKAKNWLDGQLAPGAPSPQAAPTPEIAVTPTEASEARKEPWEITKDNIRAELVNKKAGKEALFAFDKSYEKRFRPAMRPIIMKSREDGRFTHNDPAIWAEIHEQMIASNEDYKKAFDQAPAQVPVTAEKPVTVAEDTAEKSKFRTRKELLVQLTNEQKTKFTQLESVIFADNDNKMQHFEEIKTRQINDYEKLRDKKKMDPGTWFLHFKEIEGSAPHLAFEKYKEIYENAEDVDRDPANDPEVLTAFGALERVIMEYYSEVNKISQSKRTEYYPKILKLMGKYDLPDGMSLGDIEPNYYETVSVGEASGTYKRENYYYTGQRQKVLPESLRSGETAQKFIESYFTKFPIKKLKNTDDLKSYLKEPKDKNLQLVKNYVINDDKEVINRLNELILFRNMYSFNTASKSLTAAFDKDFQNSVSGLDKTLVAKYFSPEKENETNT